MMLNDRVRALQYGDTWYLEVVCGLGLEVLSCYLAFCAARQDLAVNAAAWQARNLLELNIWARFVLISKDNARRFHEDGWVDANDLLKAFSQYPENEKEVAQARLVSEEMFRLLKVIDEKDRFLKIGAIADSLGLGTDFLTLNKLYSKFVHVTSFSTLARDAAQDVKRTLVSSFEQSTTPATRETLTRLGDHLESLANDP